MQTSFTPQPGRHPTVPTVPIGGVEFAFPKLPEFTTALEMRWTQYDSVSIGNGVSLQPDQLQAMVRLNWNFGSLFYEDPPAGRRNYYDP
jgi:hypothetical protein